MAAAVTVTIMMVIPMTVAPATANNSQYQVGTPLNIQVGVNNKSLISNHFVSGRPEAEACL